MPGEVIKGCQFLILSNARLVTYIRIGYEHDKAVLGANLNQFMRLVGENIQVPEDQFVSLHLPFVGINISRLIREAGRQYPDFSIRRTL